MPGNVIKALVLIQNWGDKTNLLKELNSNNHVISIFHIMGKYSYLIDVNFDNKEQLETWINKFKSIEISQGIPAVRDMQTQKILNIYKQKSSYSLETYQNNRDNLHFFVIIDAPHFDDNMIRMMKSEEIVHSLVHIQGYNSLIAEIITPSEEQYSAFLTKMREIESINRLNILEVIHVTKFRNQVIDAVGNLAYPDTDIRELFTL